MDRETILRYESTLAMVEAIVGVGVNPFLNGPFGTFHKPDGRKVRLTTHHLVKYWSLKGQKGSIAHDRDNCAPIAAQKM